MRQEPTPFRLNIPEAALEDLRGRLARTRLPDEPPLEPWSTGTSRAYVEQLVAYWESGFDWRAQEASLNRFRQFTVPLGGIELHFIHEPGRGPNPIPLLLSHGWPGSIVEFRRLIPLLTECFTVVAPSLPGYTLSFRPGQKRFAVEEIADLFAELMSDVLGYRRFAAQGGDWGSLATEQLARSHAGSVVGIHLTDVPFWHLFQPPKDPSGDEKKFLERNEKWMKKEGAYALIQGTRPGSLAQGLQDSPTGLASWIVDKFHAWSDCGGDLERSFAKDDLLTNIMLYWISGAIGSSFWPYYARQHEGWPLPAERRVEVPTAYLSFPKDILHPPRRLAERAFNIQRWTVSPSGGHFAALEEPERLVEDVRAFFRPLR